MLGRLIAGAQRYHASYGGGLANHLPMALVALERMGAGPQKLRDFAGDYITRLQPVTTRSVWVNADNWRQSLGIGSDYPALLGFFEAEVARLGWRESLATYLPVLAPGVGAAAFHALIRTAFGVIAEVPTEIAAGLAYWASDYLKLPTAAAESPAFATPEPGDLLDRLRRDSRFDHEVEDDALIDDAMLKACDHPEFAEIVAALLIDADTPRRLAASAAALHAATNDFTALHTVTGMHALRVILPYVPEPTALLRAGWAAYAAAYLSIGKPALPTAAQLTDLRAAQMPDWQAIMAAATAADDEHVIKLCYACLEDGRLTGDRIYRWLAARAAGLTTAE